MLQTSACCSRHTRLRPRPLSNVLENNGNLSPEQRTANSQPRTCRRGSALQFSTHPKLAPQPRGPCRNAAKAANPAALEIVMALVHLGFGMQLTKPFHEGGRSQDSRRCSTWISCLHHEAGGMAGREKHRRTSIIMCRKPLLLGGAGEFTACGFTASRIP